MRFRGHGNAVAIALAGLAVVLAATGTAVAVTAGRVQITDPRSPSHVARVDSLGRLTTVATVGGTVTAHVTNPVSTINAVASVFEGSTSALTDPTTATLAVTAISYDNAMNTDYPNTGVDVRLVRTTVGSLGHCYDADATSVAFRADGVARGASTSASFSTPLLFRPVKARPYCIGVRTTSANTTQPSSYYALQVSVSGYPYSGSYTGLGTAARPAATARPTLRRR